ncbi:hypothetical protein KBX50_08475 [Micromonospora sp. C51]|uniref:hypothetical protein n=1 Tax=Micromonospora sp. C51 TaxID=2824879 RepID=UPI001B385486|nr:hypothetical protein [Micromonospora sp. C51]MBQ1048498.1 hypothetical protein [Micromonospora sp. C51]
MAHESESALTKLTVNLTPAALAAYRAAADDLGDTHTDTINRAVQLYRHVTTLRPGQAVHFDIRPGQRMTLLCTSPLLRTERACLVALLLVLAFAAGAALF